MEAAENKVAEHKEDKNNLIGKKLLSVKQMCEYMSIGESTARKLLANPSCPYVCKIEGRIFANKTVLDKWIDSNTGR